MSSPDTAETTPATRRRPEDDRLPAGPTLSFGLQHILSMFGGVIAVPIIIGGAAGLTPDKQALLVSCSLFVSGLATILQSVGVPYLGSQLPLVQGISFASVSTLLAIIGKNGETGLRSAFGACIVAGIIAFLVVPLFAQIIRFFPPVVTGSVITVIGLTLMPAACGWILGSKMIAGKANPDYGNPKAIVLAALTLAVVLILSRIKKVARLAILLGLVGGSLLAIPFGMLKTPDLSTSSPLALPMPFAFGAPIFEGAAIFSMFIVFIVVMVETTADIVAVSEVVGTDCPTHRVADGLRADMLSSALAPVFNTFPATAFAQNVGLVALTGITSRYVVAAGGAILAVLGLSPWLAAVIGMIPLPVLGGAGLALFGSVAASGIRTLSKVDYDANNNLLIVAVSIAFGIIPKVSPDFWAQCPEKFRLVAESGISACAIVAFMLNIFFNMLGKHADTPIAHLRAHAPARAVDHDTVTALPDHGRSRSERPCATTRTSPQKTAADSERTR
ncbi:Uric acid transporter UacT [Austwickia sp. TVS 96-490-7B]|uniref:nucleobase:cation symporter-2 family protein n=1 Tax=Austwickia sp. TVS 96-490-7B TaxID=2830843 RepID=UPI001C57694E|nr:nucleobase:cation symporter-2 family protein [Austwickia sp. TVS 96-490-7B]MBW3086996.1 Uric acid transporter UacT [Austwickia sp. TVS 96-490-7B]